MSEETTKNPDYDLNFLNEKQAETITKATKLLKGLTIKEAKEVLYFIRKNIEETKIS
jgi:hypothetical protein